MAAAVRESFFPAIKCSMCNADVEISQMGDHICSADIEEPKSSIFQLFKGKSRATQKLAGLPRIDPAAANQTYQGRDTLTPSSSTTGSARSPPTPRDGQPLRTPTHSSPSLSPHPQTRTYNVRKGSSASIYNIDNPFPPFKSPRISPMSPHALPRGNTEKGYYPHQAPPSPAATGGRSVSSRMNNIAPGPFGVNHNNTSRDRLHDTLPTVAASFPERSSSRGVRANAEALPTLPDWENKRLQRRDQIERGGYVGRSERDRERERDYDVPRRMPTSGSDHSSRARRSQSPGSPYSRQPPKERNAPPVPSLAFGQRGGKIRTDEPKSTYNHQSRYSDTGPRDPMIEGLRPKTSAITLPNNPGHGRKPSGRLPPHPGVGLPRSPSVTVSHKKNKSLTNPSKVLPTTPLPNISDLAPEDKRNSDQRRKPSLGSNKLGEDMPKGAPLLGKGISPPRPGSPPAETRPPLRRLSPPNPNEYSDFSIGNPYGIETPVEDPAPIASPSISSNASSIFSHRSERSSASMTSNPPTPDVNQALKSSGSRYDRERRTPSNATRGSDSNGFNDIDGLMLELQNSVHGLAPAPLQARSEERSLPTPRKHTRAPSHDRQGPIPPPPAPLQRQPPPPGVYQEPPPPKPAPAALQTRPLQYQEKLNIQRARTPPPPAPQPVDELYTKVQPQPQPQAKQERTARRPVASKGNCRGCGEGILGKSISSADGRLTGRYHKACFVCQDCHKPFESAEFYVHNNLPYCERHYHKLNNSLCPTCDRGIEGPCLETEWHERFHPSCFSCSECVCALGGDYFEFNGRPYCERHAYQMIQGNNIGPGRMAKMERRKTRMMFM